MSHVVRLALALLLVAGFAGSATAAVPSAANSSFPSCLATCPYGDLHVVVVVRDLANNPVAGALVDLEFADCPGAFLCAQRPNYGYTVDPVTRTVRMIADASGTADFPLHVGGVCAAGGVRLFANGVFFASYALASPDQNGDGVVIGLFGTDFPTYNSKVGTTDPTADFDCSGSVNDDDTLIFNQHGAHACDGIVLPTKPRNWGSLKWHYR